MKSLMLFLQHVLEDSGTWCRTSTSRDLKTITARFEHEGLSFLTITLSNFGSDVQKCLDQGFVGHDQFVGFSRTGGLPRFLGGFLDQVFDRDSGRLLHEPSVLSIHALRQICLMFSKMDLPCSDARTRRALRKYVECEQDIRRSDAAIDPKWINAYSRVSSMLWSNVFQSVDELVFGFELIPKHGPGATADKLRGNTKWNQREWTERLESMFPHGDYLASWRLFDSLSGVSVLEPEAERPVRVVTVRKTLKTPRIIGIEPTCMQYMQQGLAHAFELELQKDDTLWDLIGWRTQEPNQLLAKHGSSNGSLATLDLSEASDRVSNQHVRALLANFPNLLEGVDSSRSRKADVPGHGVLRLAKFASMGSALCFPMESMVFLTIVLVGIEQKLNRRLTRKDVESFRGRVRIYGDDIIVPVEFVPSVSEALATFGLRVNAGKSYWNGKFRESCGKEYYNGNDVSIVRISRFLPARRYDVPEIVSTVSLRNRMYISGMWKTAGYLDSLLERLIPFPRVAETSPLLGRLSFLGPDNSGKLHHNTHRPLVRGMKVVSKSPASKLDGYGALRKCLTLLELRNSSTTDDGIAPTIPNHDLPYVDVEHLERQGRPHAVVIKLRKGPSS